ncbi:hypothetical protein LCGC14_0487320 [marine sediment metagenome]|uniref:Band 7 domain-containing protein n=1 Tax=marine sediment metagenome TaxID=412755 RepID=A0A0F9VGI6_9ZZZZ
MRHVKKPFGTGVPKSMDFLNRIFEILWKFIPRIKIIQPDELAVRVTLGTREKVLYPGWYLFLGIFQEIFYTTVTTQIKDLRSQSVASKGGRDLILSGAIKYKVVDIRKAMLEVQDYDRSLEALCLGVLLAVVSTMTEKELMDTEKLGENILKKTREEAAGWGLKLQKVYITDLGKARNIRLLTNNTGVCLNG